MTDITHSSLGTLLLDPPGNEFNLDDGDNWFDEIIPIDTGGDIEGVRVYWDDGMLNTDYEGADEWTTDSHNIGKYLRVWQDGRCVAEYAPYQWSSVCWISADRDGPGADQNTVVTQALHPSMLVQESAAPGEAV